MTTDYGVWLSNVSWNDPCIWCGYKTKRFGPPKASKVYSVDALKRMGMKGLYVSQYEYDEYQRTIRQA